MNLKNNDNIKKILKERKEKTDKIKNLITI